MNRTLSIDLQISFKKLPIEHLSVKKFLKNQGPTGKFEYMLCHHGLGATKVTLNTQNASS